MKWFGVKRDVTDVARDLSAGEDATNHRYSVDGELRRRRGMAKSNVEKQASCVKNILGFSTYGSQIAATFLTCAGSWIGYTGVTSLWNDDWDNPDDPRPPEPPDTDPVIGYGVLTDAYFYTVPSDFSSVIASTSVSASNRSSMIRHGDGVLTTTASGVTYIDWAANKTVRFSWSTSPRAIVESGGRYFAGGSTSGAQSNDGINWTATTYVPGTYLYEVSANESSIFAVGETNPNEAWIEKASFDFDNGFTLTWMPDAGNGGHCDCSAVRGRTVVVTGPGNSGNSTVRVCYSNDGGNSYSVASGRPPDLGNRIGQIVRSNGSIFLLALSDGTLWSSSDGSSWTQVYAQSGSWNVGGDYYALTLQSCEDGYFYMLLNRTQYLHRSRDGANWENTGMQVSGYLAGVIPRY